MKTFRSRPSRVHTNSGGGSTAFSLIEMLVVIAIITTLVGMLMGGISMARAASRRARAYNEVVNIAAAWQHYYSEYQRWPVVLNDGDPHAIEGEVAALLAAGTYGPQNPRRIRFCQFNRVNGDGAAINPWGDAEADTAEADWLYYVAVDHDFNNQITDPLGSNVTGRSVIVWTANGDRQPTDDDYYVGDWR